MKGLNAVVDLAKTLSARNGDERLARIEAFEPLTGFLKLGVEAAHFMRASALLVT